MKESMIATVLSTLCGLLLLTAIAGICLKDRTAPVISLNGKNTLTYTEGDSYDVLLAGMTAEDVVDGDVTDTIRISSIHVTEDGKAVVRYVAKDLSNNIGKLKREVKYIGTVTKLEAEQDGKTNSDGAEPLVSAGIARVTGR